MTFSKEREHLLYAFSESLTNIEDFALLCHLNTSENWDFHYWEYDLFDLDAISEDDAYAEFVFLKNDIKRLETALRRPSNTSSSVHLFAATRRRRSISTLAIWRQP